MDKLKTTILKAISLWSLFGVFLIGIGSTGIIPVNEALINLFSQEIVTKLQELTDIIFQGWGIITLIGQALRAVFSKPVLVSARSHDVILLSDSDIKRIIRSPFAIV